MRHLDGKLSGEVCPGESAGPAVRGPVARALLIWLCAGCAAAPVDGGASRRTRGALTTADVAFTGGEMLGQPTDHAVTVKAIASAAVEAYVEYGPAPGTFTAMTAAASFADGIVSIVVDGLAPDTLYSYRIEYRAAGTGDAFVPRTEHTLRTQRAKGASFTFAVQSDSHLGYPSASFNDPTLYGVTMANIAAEGPDFLLDLGDAVSTDDATETVSTVETKYLNQRAYFEIPGHASPIFLVLGNHENEEGWNLDDFGADEAMSLPVLGANARKKFFLNPVPNAFYSGNIDPLPALGGDHLRGDYYAFTWGDALFVAIDPYWYTLTKPYPGAIGGEKDDEVVGTRWDWTLGATQYQWLQQTLAASQASFKFIFSHQEVGGIEDYGRGGALGAPYCEWGGENLDGTPGFATNRPGWPSSVHALMVQNHVTAFIHGHDHVYAQETLDGIVYQEVPMPADGSYGTGFSTNAREYAGAKLLSNSGHLRVTVTPIGATVDYVRSYRPDDHGTNGTVAASYTMAGCTADSDGDGARDCYDGCPADPAKTAPGRCGCGFIDPAGDSACAPATGGLGGAGGAGGAGWGGGTVGDAGGLGGRAGFQPSGETGGAAGSSGGAAGGPMAAAGASGAEDGPGGGGGAPANLGVGGSIGDGGVADATLSASVHSPSNEGGGCSCTSVDPSAPAGTPAGVAALAVLSLLANRRRRRAR